MDENVNPRRSGRVWAGLFLVGVGAVLVLDQMGFPLPDWLFNWPAILIVIGLFIGIRHGFRGGAWLILILIGTAFEFQNYYPQIEVHRYIFPGILIVIGILFVLNPGRRGRYWGDDWHSRNRQWKDQWKQQRPEWKDQWKQDWKREWRQHRYGWRTGSDIPGSNPSTGANPTPGSNSSTGSSPGSGANPNAGANPNPGANPTAGANPNPTFGSNPNPGANPTAGSGPASGAVPNSAYGSTAGSTSGEASAGTPGGNNPNFNPGFTSSGSRGYTSEDYIDTTTFFGGIHKKIVTKNFKGGDLVTIFGGTELDLTQADFTGTVRLDVVQICGATKIIVPASWEVRSEVTAIFAGFEDKRQQPTPHNPDKVLILDGTSLMGGIELRNY